jgi:epoxyqueuosine reductase
VTNNPSLSAALKDEAARLGFASCGIAPADRSHASELEGWLEQGFHGSMDWMETRKAERGGAQALWPEAQSVIVLALAYPGPPERDPDDWAAHGLISAYAQGADYHDVVKRGLKALARWLVDRTGCALKVFVDTAPVMEKPLGALAGLGWQGKHTNLVSRQLGNWFFLGAIMTDLDLEPDAPHADRCGSCTACQTACPTSAFPAPYRLDARRCISYLTIEHKGAIPEEFRRAMGNRIYGCDDCLAACPWNRFAKTAASHRAFLPRAELAAPALGDLLALDDAGFRQVFSGSPIKRIGRDRMVRNAAIAAGNSRDVGLMPALQRLAEADPSDVVRDAAKWALAELTRPDAPAIAGQVL